MPAITTSYTYEDNSDVKTAVINGSVATYGYTYDALGRRTARTQSGTAFPQTVTDQFGYNDRSEVISSERHATPESGLSSPLENHTFGYQYDHIGNRIETTKNAETTNYISNNLNQYSSVSFASSAVNPVFDLDGNLTQDDTWHYHWNGENRLVAMTPVAPIEGSKKLTFWYDYQGRRFQKRTETLQSGQWTLTDERKFLYDDWNLIAEYKLNNSSFNLHTSYTWGLDLSLTPQGAGGVGGLLKSTNYSLLTTSYYLYDANGNVGQLVDSQGNITESYEYSPFGEVLTATGSTAEENVFRFSTKYEDAETELLYYGFRYYDPEMGRWLNRDPIGEQGGFNVYAFSYNNLLNLIDVLGLKPKCSDCPDCSSQEADVKSLGEKLAAALTKSNQLNGQINALSPTLSASQEAYIAAGLDYANALADLWDCNPSPWNMGCQSESQALAKVSSELYFARSKYNNLNSQMEGLQESLEKITSEAQKLSSHLQGAITLLKMCRKYRENCLKNCCP